MESTGETHNSRALGRHVLLALLALPMVLPFVWMLATSLKPLAEVEAATWLPSRPVWDNYAAVFRVVPFARFLWNSLLVACWVTFLQVLTSALAAFSFARLRWPGRDRVFTLYLATTMLPGLVLMIPNYRLMIGLGLVDSLVGVVLPGAFTAIGTFLLRQYMLSIPRDYDNAAAIDGANHWQVFWEITMPLCKPALIVLAILTFLSNYHSFFWPLVMLRSVEKYTLPVGLLYFDSTRGQATHLLMAAVTMSVLPLLALFVLLQRHLARGVQLGVDRM